MTLPELVGSIGKWHEFHKRSRSPMFTEFILGCPGLRKDDFPFDNRVKHFGILLDHVTIEDAEKERLAASAIGYLKDHPMYLLELMERAYKEHADAKAKWEKVDREELASLSSQELAAHFKDYADTVSSFGIYVTLPLFAESYFESFLKEEFDARFGAESQAYFGIAVDPVRNATVLDEEIARLTLVIEGRVDEGLPAHVRRFGWMNNTGFYETYYDEAHYRSSLPTREEAEHTLRNLLHERGLHKERFYDLLSKVADDTYLSAIVRTANEAVFFRSYRTEMIYSSSAYNQNLFRAVGTRLGLSDYRNLVWLYTGEVITALGEGALADQECIARRKTGYVFLSEFDGVYHHAEGEEAQAAYRAYASVEETAGEAPTHVKGSGAFLGNVRGKAAVVHSFDELSKVEEGDVLITHATNVDFVPVLRKVAGIVTEEGGILSHAAIISRELRIPCVIGTKIATSVFKDGDIVEVDAKAGTVRVLERAR